MENTDLQVFPSTFVKDDDEDEVRNLVIRIRKSWPKEDIIVQAIKQFPNKSYACHLREDPGREDGILVRIWTHWSEGLPHMDRDFEVAAMQVASQLGCGPHMYAIFQNGAAMRFINGRTLKLEDIHNPVCSKALAVAIATYHCADVDRLTVYKRTGDPYLFDKAVRMMKQIESVIQKIPDSLPDPDQHRRLKEDFPSKSEIADEFKHVLDFLDVCNVPVVLSHHDFHLGNCIFSEAEGKVYLIDFEGSSFSYETFDFANYLGFMKMIVDGFKVSGRGTYKEVTEDTLRDWLKDYLQAKRAICIKNKSKTDKDGSVAEPEEDGSVAEPEEDGSVAEQELDTLHQATLDAHAVYWMFVTVLYATYSHYQGADMLGCAILGYNEYKKYRHRLLPQT